MDEIKVHGKGINKWITGLEKIMDEWFKRLNERMKDKLLICYHSYKNISKGMV